MVGVGRGAHAGHADNDAAPLASTRRAPSPLARPDTALDRAGRCNRTGAPQRAACAAAWLLQPQIVVAHRLGSPHGHTYADNCGIAASQERRRMMVQDHPQKSMYNSIVVDTSPQSTVWG